MKKHDRITLSYKGVRLTLTETQDGSPKELAEFERLREIGCDRMALFEPAQLLAIAQFEPAQLLAIAQGTPD